MKFIGEQLRNEPKQQLNVKINLVQEAAVYLN